MTYYFLTSFTTDSEDGLSCKTRDFPEVRDILVCMDLAERGLEVRGVTVAKSWISSSSVFETSVSEELEPSRSSEDDKI